MPDDRSWKKKYHLPLGIEDIEIGKLGDLEPHFLHGQRNFLEWKRMLLAVLEVNALEGYVDGTTKEPYRQGGMIDEHGRDPLARWKHEDLIVRRLIKYSIKPHVWRTLSVHDDSKTQFDFIEAIYKQPPPVSKKRQRNKGKKVQPSRIPMPAQTPHFLRDKYSDWYYDSMMWRNPWGA